MFGQTDGAVVSHLGTVLSTETGAVEHLTCMVKGYVATTDDGLAVGRTGRRGKCAGHPTVHRFQPKQRAMEHDGSSLLWLARDAGLGSTVHVWATNQEGAIANGQFAKVRAMHGTTERVVIGCEDGQIHAWEREMLHRRLDNDQSSSSDEADERTSALQAKLRALRQ